MWYSLTFTLRLYTFGLVFPMERPLATKPRRVQRCLRVKVKEFHNNNNNLNNLPIIIFQFKLEDYIYYWKIILLLLLILLFTDH